MKMQAQNKKTPQICSHMLSDSNRISKTLENYQRHKSRPFLLDSLTDPARNFITAVDKWYPEKSHGDCVSLPFLFLNWGGVERWFELFWVDFSRCFSFGKIIFGMSWL